MEPFSIERLPDLPAIVTVIQPGFRVYPGMLETDAAGRAILAHETEPLFNVLDIRDFEFSIEDMLQATNHSSRGSDPMWHDARLRETIFITESSLAQLAAAGLNSFSFGYLKVRVMTDLDSALAYIREQVATTAAVSP